jgi:16S rRNA (cytosine1402-N4)-methyltransferase
MAAHQPVLLTETVDLLRPRTGGVLVDATCGAGGHTQRLAEAMGERGRVVAIDQDDAALMIARERLAELMNVTFVEANFRELPAILHEQGLTRVDGILADLGVSSMMFDRPERGFSFNSDAELDMRMSRRNPVTAAQLLREADEEELGRIFRDYGEEPRWRAVARAVVEHRRQGGGFAGTEFRRLAHRAIGKPRAGGVDSATRVFQALRIAVNDELGALEEFLDAAIEALAPGGRLAVISFHSLEDRVVKHRLREAADGCRCPRDLPRCICGAQATVRVLTPHPVTPGREEIRSNPRARSAKLRAAEKLGEANHG